MPYTLINLPGKLKRSFLVPALLAREPGLSQGFIRCFLVVVVYITTVVSAQELCNDWQGSEVGQLDTKLIPEASGMQLSSLVPGRLYHINDSGFGPEFFVSNLEGQMLQTVTVKGFEPLDTEALGSGPCANSHCLYIGDIGDNLRQRDSLQIVLVEEQQRFPALVSPFRILSMRYPDGAHDAEAMLVTAEATIYILTKSPVSILRTPPARLYRLSADTWQAEDGPQVLELVALVDLGSLSGNSVDIFSHIATGMDLSADGQRVMILTYGNAFEVWAEDLLGAALEPRLIDAATTHQQIPLQRLPQQESLAYIADQTFVYTTEARFGVSPLLQFECLTE